MSRPAMTAALLLSFGCAVTQTGNPSLDPEDGGIPDASSHGFDLAQTEVLPSPLNDPGTNLRFIFGDEALGGTLRVASMNSDVEALEVDATPSTESSHVVPGFEGDWIRVQLISSAGPHEPIDAVIGSESLTPRAPSCLEVVRSIQLSHSNATTVRNGCAESLSVTVRSRASDSALTAEPSQFTFAVGESQSVSFGGTLVAGSIRDFLLESSTGSAHQTAAVSVLFD